MAKCNPKHKDKLMQLMQWAEFVAYRDELIVEHEMTSTKANKAAVVKFLGAAAGETAGVPKKVVVVPKTTSTDDSVDAGQAAVDAGEKRPPNKDGSVISSIPGPPAPAAMSAFAHKPPVSEIVNIIWVCDHMRVVNLDPRQCPSLRAWNLMCECREDPYFRRTFWKDQYGKTVPAKNTLDDGTGNGKADGALTMDLITKVQAASESAKKETATDD